VHLGGGKQLAANTLPKKLGVFFNRNGSIGRVLLLVQAGAIQDHYRVIGANANACFRCLILELIAKSIAGISLRRSQEELLCSGVAHIHKPAARPATSSIAC
jgi:hypothetical protein